MRILVIDNDININGLIKSVLSMEKDFSTDFALSGKEGLKKLKSEKFDLVLVDLLMPEVTGFDICKFMSADEDLKTTPVVIVSAMPINDKDYQRENGNFQNFPVVKGLLEKPFDVHELITKIRAIVQVYK
jgi:DNA-binding response OmpR family regulator